MLVDGRFVPGILEDDSGVIFLDYFFVNTKIHVSIHEITFSLFLEVL
jgi:hypothetical protein